MELCHERLKQAPHSYSMPLTRDPIMYTVLYMPLAAVPKSSLPENKILYSKTETQQRPVCGHAGLRLEEWSSFKGRNCGHVLIIPSNWCLAE